MITRCLSHISLKHTKKLKKLFMTLLWMHQVRLQLHQNGANNGKIRSCTSTTTTTFCNICLTYFEWQNNERKGKSLPKKSIIQKKEKVTWTVSSLTTLRVEHVKTSPTRHYNFVSLLFYFLFLVLASNQESLIRVQFSYHPTIILASSKCVSHLYQIYLDDQENLIDAST